LRQLAAELNRLTDELQRDKKIWEETDKKMNTMVDSWWTKVLGSGELN
jgi:hypothetical protein